MLRKMGGYDFIPFTFDVGSMLVDSILEFLASFSHVPDATVRAFYDINYILRLTIELVV